VNEGLRRSTQTTSHGRLPPTQVNSEQAFIRSLIMQPTKRALVSSTQTRPRVTVRLAKHCTNERHAVLFTMFRIIGHLVINDRLSV